MFSTKAEYGVRVMAHLARSGGDSPISLGTIADAEGLPLAYLEHLVQRLRKAVLVCSREHHENHEPCPTKFLWTRVQGSIVRTLNEMTLDDLVQPLTRTKKATTTV